MTNRLEKPDADDDLYLARGDEVPPSRPLMTGDVFPAVEIPGVLPNPTVALVVTHPCSMRNDGVHLAPLVHLALVEPCEPVPWASCPRDRMPLPSLRGDAFHVVRLDVIGMTDPSLLELDARIACMSVRGINLLQQRLIWYFTRLEAPTAQLTPLFAPVFEEVDLQEEWVEAAISAGTDVGTAIEDFHDWIRAVDDGGLRRQDRLRDPQARAMVRRELSAETRRRYVV